MITSLSTILNEGDELSSEERTVRCRVESEPLPGKTGGEKTLYHVGDQYDDVDDEVFLSFWTENPTTHEQLEQTAPYVLSTLEIPTGEELEKGTHQGGSLQRGESLIVRAIPNRRRDGALYLNVTSFVVRTPDKLISKSKLRTQDRCSREYYLRYVKQVYPGDKFDTNPGNKLNRFRGDAIHKATELALEEHPERFREENWTESDVTAFCESMFDSEFGFRQALLVISGAGLDVKSHVFEAVSKLFTDEGFCKRVRSADSLEVERFLSNEFGYAGRVDILLDGVPLDIKTTHNPDSNLITKHSRQVKMYLFALLLERIGPGESFQEAIDEGRTGELIYPNTADETVRFEEVSLTMDDVVEFLTARNDVIETGGAFAPPSTYNRDCEGCAFSKEEWINGPDDALPPACTYHCQNERRWPCYDTDGGELTSDCSLFGSCDQRTQYRDPDVVDHYESVRSTFRQEESARRTAKRIVDTLDDDVLTEAGYLVPELSCTGATSAGAVIRFTTPNPVVPAFEPGDIVELEVQGGGGGRAVYYGTADGEYHFSPLDESIDISDFLTTDAPVRALYTFSVESVQERYLPYLDFAQRRNNGAPRHASTGSEVKQPVPDEIEISSIPEYLDREQVFVDVPVGTNRNAVIAELVQEIVTSAHPHPEADGETISSDKCRTLVLGTRPDLVETAVAGQPTGEHYRLDGTGGEGTIENEDGYHEIQTKLLNSRSIVSTVQQATSKAGPGGIREFFHRLQTAPFSNREHTSNFFDSLIILGAERLTEPEYDFLADIADQVVAVGDVRRTGPTLLSGAATDANLDSHFQTKFERYRSFPTHDAVSLQVTGGAPPALREFYQTGPWDSIDGDLTFLSVEGDEETALNTVELQATVPAANGEGKRLVFDVTDTPLSPMAAHELFENRIELDATALRPESIVVLDERSLFLQSKDELEGGGASHHHVVIQTIAAELPQFSRALLSNDIAEQIVAEVVEEQEPDVVVTPFERHATSIKRKLTERDIDVPVKRPESLSGTVTGHSVVSFATANETGIVRPPLDDPAVLYSMLSSGRELTMVGNRSTLKSKDIFGRLIEKAEPYHD